MFIFTTILSWLGSLLGGPFIKAALSAYQAKLTSENTTQSLKEQLAARELDVQLRETELQTQYRIATIGRWYEPDHLMGYAVAIYFGKLLVWDKVLALGVTDPLAGWASFTANLIVTYYFAKRGVENVLKIWRMK
jgi:hypothetical protein